VQDVGWDAGFVWVGGGGVVGACMHACSVYG
jgi:hypothetical protein